MFTRHTWVRIPLFPCLILFFYNLLYSVNKFFDSYTLISLKGFVSTYSRAWNPYFFNFILGSRNRLTILDPVSTYIQMKKSLFFLRNIFIKGGKLMIINEFNTLNIYQSNNYTV